MNTDTETTERDRRLSVARSALERVGCQFWACPGPDQPHQDMATCYVCVAIQETR